MSNPQDPCYADKAEDMVTISHILSVNFVSSSKLPIFRVSFPGSRSDVPEDTEDNILRWGVSLRSRDTSIKITKERERTEQVRLRRRVVKRWLAKFIARAGNLQTISNLDV